MAKKRAMKAISRQGDLSFEKGFGNSMSFELYQERPAIIFALSYLGFYKQRLTSEVLTLMARGAINEEL